jgi:hypothetical protein
LDCPGFNDNKGVIQDVINGYYIDKLFQGVEKIRIVVLQLICFPKIIVLIIFNFMILTCINYLINK